LTVVFVFFVKIGAQFARRFDQHVSTNQTITVPHHGNIMGQPEDPLAHSVSFMSDQPKHVAASVVPSRDIGESMLMHELTVTGVEIFGDQ
jgi:hypothetical protein